MRCSPARPQRCQGRTLLSGLAQNLSVGRQGCQRVLDGRAEVRAERARFSLDMRQGLYINPF
jgi:hypothetical protein